MDFSMKISETIFSVMLLISSLILVVSPAAARNLLSLNNQTDFQALISIKSHIMSDPHGFLASWNDSTSFCNWQGVNCSIRHQRVVRLNMSGMDLSGTLSPYIGNLTFLKVLRLRDNAFHGKIPQEIGRLYRLVNISLYNNSFHGEIPTNLAQCSGLRVISLGINGLQGKVPSEFSSLSNLQYLGLHKNSLSGSIPSSLGNLSALRYLWLSDNNLSGSIPTEFAKLSNLEQLQLSFNILSGAFPSRIFNISSIRFLMMANNSLNGSFPWDLGLHLPILEKLFVGGNLFSGPLPASITNASSLEYLVIGLNALSGPIPMNIGNLERLQMLHLNDNNLRGNLPSSITNLSTALFSLRLDGNYISGGIPESIGILSKLQGLSLSRNYFTGGIPSSIGNISYLTILEMRENLLDGVIPSSLSNCKVLLRLDLSHNRLTGDIPVEILGLYTLVGLSIAQNQLSGHLPLGVGNLINLARLDVSSNNLLGALPDKLESCLSLEFLSLKGNRFDGKVPDVFGSLKGLQFLDLSNNNLYEAIPASLAKIASLRYLNLSFNDFEGEVPSDGLFRNPSAFSIAGNTKLCGGIRSLQLPVCRRPKETEVPFTVMAILLTASYLTFALLVHCFLFRCCTREARDQTREASSDPAVGDHYRKLSYRELSQATDGFSPTNLIAMGKYSSVYKGILKYSEQKVAIKVVNLQQGGARKSFEAECEALRNIRHRNLVKIITSCSGTDFEGSEFKALVFEFMPNGSLENWLHPISTDSQQNKNLDLIERLNIAIDVASAIHYLHNCCEIRVIHRDIKPSNILLDHRLIAHLGDFGSARSLLLPIEKSTQLRIRSSAMGIIGTVGYVALECGMGGPVSTPVDVYSYGILLLEMFSGKRPTDSMFLDDFSLHNYVKMAIPNQVLTVTDPRLLLDSQAISEKTEKCLASIFHIGLLCSAPSRRARMDIADALMIMKAIRDAFLRFDETAILNSFDGITSSV